MRVSGRRSPLLPGGLALFLFPFFIYGGPPPVSTPGPTSPAVSRPAVSYNLQVNTQQLPDRNHPILSHLTFTGDGKPVWQIRENAPLGKTVLIHDTGRCFCEVDYPGAPEIRVYSKSGRRLWVQKGRLLAVSFDGNFMAFQNTETAEEGERVSVQTINPLDHRIYRFTIDHRFNVKAVALDGRALLIGGDENSSAGVMYGLVDEAGRVIWVQKGRGIFWGLKNHGKWVVFYRGKEKSVEFVDFKTGRWLDEMPRWKFDSLFNPPPKGTAPRKNLP